MHNTYIMLSTLTTSDPGIICFQHCTTKIFCFNFPETCPACKIKLVEKDLKLLPFRLPYPFIKASQYPCAIVLRPTIGDYLNDYNNSKDLHIAVTTSKGIIVEFDQNGLQQTNVVSPSAAATSPWSQSLLVESVPEPWYDLWDTVLNQISKQPNWSVSHYHEDEYNCYTFVLTFLQALCYEKLSKAAQSKTVFCEKYIVPRTTTAGKYISLYRKIRDRTVYIHSIITKDLNINNTKQEQNNDNNNTGVVTSRKLCTIEE